MKKQPIYLYVLGGLSLISMFSRLKEVFFPTHVEMTFESSGDAQVDALVKASIQVGEQGRALSTDLVNKGLVLLMLALLVAVAVFLFKKWYEKAGWTYVGYLVTTLVATLYNFLASRALLNSITDETSRQILGAGAMGVVVFQVITFIVFLGMTLFNLLRKPKTTKVENTSGTI
ncbi:hypothetical protein [Streptococcus merionis]|uniref:ABC transporter permease n=1 Tax=Streptococcus merionis TaxID=400065 RepID=UPI0026EC436B|nr:hypothetical protein [Streptococcus merionis]